LADPEMCRTGNSGKPWTPCTSSPVTFSPCRGSEATTGKALPTCWRGDFWQVRLLLAIGADPNGLSDNCIQSFEFSYPIQGAAWNNHPEIIRLLVKAGASVNVFDSEGGSPLCDAVREGATEAAEVLLSYGARTTTENGTSVLSVARRFGHEDIARLVESTSKINRTNEAQNPTKAEQDAAARPGSAP